MTPRLTPLSRRALLLQSLALALGWIVVSINHSLIYPLLSMVANDLHLSAMQAGTVASAYFLFIVVTQIPLGVFADRIGLKRVLIGSYGIETLALLGLGLLAHSYVLLLFFVALMGVGAACQWPVANSLTIRGAPPEARGKASALVNAGLGVGLTAGLALGGPLFALTGSWHMSYVIMAVPTVLLAVAFYFVVKETRPKAVRGAPSAPRGGGMRAVLADRQLLTLFATVFCSLYSFWVVVVWGPSFLQSERSLGVTASGLVTGIVTLVGVSAGFVTGRLSDRLGRRQLSTVMFVLAGLSILLLVQATTTLAIMVSLVCYGLFGKMAWDPVEIAWVADRGTIAHPHDLALIMALTSAFGMSSSVIGPVVSGSIRDLTGSFGAALYLGAALAFTAAVLSRFVPESRRRPAALAAPSELA